MNRSGFVDLRRKGLRRLMRKLSEWPLSRKILFSLSTIYIQQHNQYLFSFDENGEQQLVHCLSKYWNTMSMSPVVLDVGANVGDWTKEVLQVSPSARVFAFEISPHTQSMLIQNLGHDQRVKLCASGLSSSVGEIILHQFKDPTIGQINTLSDITANREFTGQFEDVKVSVTTGDQFCQDHSIRQIHLLKIDVEGWDFEVLKGFAHLFDHQAIDVVQFEYGYFHSEIGITMKNFYAFLESKGYLIGKLTREGVLFQPYHYHLNNYESGPNFVACTTAMAKHLNQFL